MGTSLSSKSTIRSFRSTSATPVGAGGRVRGRRIEEALRAGWTSLGAAGRAYVGDGEREVGEVEKDSLENREEEEEEWSEDEIETESKDMVGGFGGGLWRRRGLRRWYQCVVGGRRAQRKVPVLIQERLLRFRI